MIDAPPAPFFFKLKPRTFIVNDFCSSFFILLVSSRISLQYKIKVEALPVGSSHALPPLIASTPESLPVKPRPSCKVEWQLSPSSSNNILFTPPWVALYKNES